MVGVTTMAHMDAFPDYASQMEGFRRSDEAREKLLEEVIHRYAKLMEDHSSLQADYTSEREIRRSYQRDIARKDLQLSTLDNSSFVLGLIDGDGVIFQDMLLLAGAHGGSEAASKLQHAIRDHISSLYNNSSHWPIMLQIYVSLDKLGQKLASVGLLKHPQELRAFAQAFNVNQPLFSIIDVGHGKERADYKIKEILRTFSDNPTCKHVVFGGCHDAGYLLNLDQYKHNQEKASRITLLESTSPQKGFVDLPNFKRARFNDVFRSEPLPEYAPSGYGQPQMQTSTLPQHQPPISAPPGFSGPPAFAPPSGIPAPAADATSSPTRTPVPAPTRTMTNRSMSPVASPVATNAKSAAVKPAPATQSPSTTATSSTTGAPTDSSGSSWAVVGKTNAPNGTLSIAPKNSSKKRYIYYNKEGQRLDEQLPPKDRAAVEAIEKRMERSGRNLCNHWHLNKNKCVNGKFCKFQHEPKLSEAETIALRYKTRSLACKNRACQNFDCYLGHQCSYERDTGYCPYPSNCNLKHTHGMDKVKYEQWDEDDNVFYAR